MHFILVTIADFVNAKESDYAQISGKVCLVHQCDLSWNQIQNSLMLMRQKLEALGFVYYNGKIEIVEPETERSEHHA